MKLKQVLDVLEGIAPTVFAESWDNVGLLAGDPSQPVTSVLLTIDYTAAVADEGLRLGADLVIAYHPPIFHPVKRLTAGSLVYDAIRRGVAIYSPHTALDVAVGGTNDVLCDVLGLGARGPLKTVEAKVSDVKLATFVPEHDVEKVAEALFAAGAGKIGDYSACSFRSPGVGTFFGEEASNPVVGQRGRLEKTPEIRIETIVPVKKVSDVVAALRRSHPYEEPAFDLFSLTPPPSGLGLGRIGDFAEPVERQELFSRLKRGLKIDHLLIAGPTTGAVRRAAVCAGACGDLINDALAKKAEIYVTGEVRHHDALKAAEAGMTVVCTLHSNSERATLSRLAERLSAELAARTEPLPIHLSQSDRDPFSVR